MSIYNFIIMSPENKYVFSVIKDYPNLCLTITNKNYVNLDNVKHIKKLRQDIMKNYNLLIASYFSIGYEEDIYILHKILLSGDPFIFEQWILNHTILRLTQELEYLQYFYYMVIDYFKSQTKAYFELKEFLSFILHHMKPELWQI